jgi:hypothetical protein
VVISVGVFLIWASRPSSSVRTGPGLLVYRLNAPLLFVNAKRLRDGIRAGCATPPPRSGSSCSICRSPQGSTSNRDRVYRDVEDAVAVADASA